MTNFHKGSLLLHLLIRTSANQMKRLVICWVPGLQFQWKVLEILLIIPANRPVH